MLTYFPVQIEAEKALTEWEAEIMKDEEFAIPFSADKEMGSDNANISNVAFGKMDGKDVAFTASKGSGNYPSYFNVVDILTGENLFNKTIPETTTVWGIVVTKKGVYIGTTGDVAAFWHFNTDKKVLKKIATLEGDKNVFNMRANDRYVTLGTFPLGKVYVYDLEKEQLIDLGVVDEGVREEGIPNTKNPEAYVRSTELYGSTVFAGTGSQNGRVWYRNIEKDDKWHLLEMPIENPNDFPNLAYIYDLNIVDNKLFVFSNGPSKVYIYDLIEGKWLDHTIDNVRGLVGVSNEFNRKVFYSHKELIPGSSNQYMYSLYSYHLDTAETKKENEQYILNLRNTQHYVVDGQDRLYTMNNAGKIQYFYIENDKLEVVTLADTVVMGQAGQIQSIHYDFDTDTLFASGYMGSQGYQRHMETGKSIRFRLGQIENMDSENGVVYFGEYPSAVVLKKNIKQDDHAHHIFSLSDENQDRPYKVLAQDGKVYIGTIGKPGETTGRLAIYDTQKPSSNTNPQIYTPLKNHSIVGIAVKGDYLYGSTTIHGGLGIDPAVKQAKVFKLNLKTGEVEIERELSELKQNITMISGLHFDSKGRLFGFTNGTVFEIDTETMKVSRHQEMHKSLSAFGKWRPIEVYYHDGKMYANPGFILTVIDPDTFEYAPIKEAISKFAVDKRGDILYAGEVSMHRMQVKVHEKSKPALTSIPLANGSFEKVDEQNKPLSWEPYFDKQYDETSYAVSDVVHTDGQYSLKIFDRNRNASMFVRSEKVPVREGETYIAKSNVYLDLGRARLFIRFYDENGKQVGKDTSKSLVYADSNFQRWQELEAKAVAPKGASHLRITVGTNNIDETEYAYFDDVRLYRLEKKVKLDVPNASFEEFVEMEGKKKPKHWTSMLKEEEKSEKVYYLQSDKQSYDGKHSLYVYDKSLEHAMYVQSEKMAVLPHDEHELTVKMFFDPQAYASRAAQVMIRYYDKEDNQVNQDVENQNFVNQIASGMTGKWFEKTIQTKAPENAAYLRIILGSNQNQATDGVYFDQVELYRIPPKEVIPAQVVEMQKELMNPSFEELDEYGRILHWTSLLKHEDVSQDVYYASSEDKATDGKRSLYLYDKDNSHSMYVASDPFKVQEGDIHHTSVDVYLVEENIASRLSNLVIRYYDENGKQLNKDRLGIEKVQVKASDKKGEWVQLKAKTVAPKGTDHMRIILGTSNASENHVGAYYDHVQLKTLRPVKDLKQLIDQAKALSLDDYTQESLQKYNEVIDEYALYLEKEIVPFDLLDAFRKDINRAKDELTKVDYVQITKLLEDYDCIDFTIIREESLGEVHALAKKAQDIVDNEERSQIKIDAISEKLESALNNLETLNREKLDEFIFDIEKLDGNFYEQESYRKLLEEVKKAKAYQGQSQLEIDALYKKIEKAKSDLKELETSRLQDMVDSVNKLDKNQYTEGSLIKLEKVVEKAQDVLINPKGNQNRIDDMIQQLENAMHALEIKKEIPVSSVPSDSEQSQNEESYEDEASTEKMSDADISVSEKEKDKPKVEEKELVSTGQSSFTYYLSLLLMTVGFMMRYVRKER